MLVYILRRLLIAIPVLIGVTIVTYGFISMAPGDPVTALLDPEQMSTLGPDWVEQQKAALGLDKPVPVRYVLWLGEAARGNLGYSAVDRRPVAQKLGERIGPTLRLMIAALLIALLVGIPIGILSAVKQYSWLDYVSNLAGLAMISIPGFFLGLAAIYLFALKLQILPTAGMATIGEPPSLWDQFRHLLLPAFVLGLAEAAPLIRYARSSMLEVIHQEYVRVARAKGLSEWTVLLVHALRNALIPLITIIALQLPTLVGGAVIIEQIFAWPGMGTLAISAIFGRDYPTIMAINLISAVMIILSSLIADVMYAVVDPRVHYN
ncbi:MAG: ABC transporter permease [Anaerolineae bacterium]|nr:ABC transporter permease [Anaerolineae bacterium]